MLNTMSFSKVLRKNCVEVFIYLLIDFCINFRVGQNTQSPIIAFKKVDTLFKSSGDSIFLLDFQETFHHIYIC